LHSSALKKIDVGIGQSYAVLKMFSNIFCCYNLDAVDDYDEEMLKSKNNSESFYGDGDISPQARAGAISDAEPMTRVLIQTQSELLERLSEIGTTNEEYEDPHDIVQLLDEIIATHYSNYSHKKIIREQFLLLFRQSSIKRGLVQLQIQGKDYYKAFNNLIKQEVTVKLMLNEKNAILLALFHIFKKHQMLERLVENIKMQLGPGGGVG